MQKYLLYRICLVIITLFTTGFAFADGIITGTVTDYQTGKPLAGANIVIVQLNTGMASNEQGEYKFENIAESKYTIKVTYIGYTDILKTVKVSNGEKINIDFRLVAINIEMSSVIVTATRTKRKIEDIPARVAIITRENIQSSSIENTDDVLHSVAGIYVNRNRGIFSKNSSVTMRGLNSSEHTLILLDGSPMNKVAGTSVNWNMIQPENIEKIEIIKGPASALYGGNAMGGVINIITKKPAAGKKIDGLFKTFVGTYNTQGGLFDLGSNKIKNAKGFYWGIDGYYRKGEGTVFEPDETKDTASSKAYLKEGKASAKAGYQFNTNNKIELEYNYYDDKRGEGRKIYEEDGSYNKYTTNLIRTKYTGGSEKTKTEINTFYKTENYFRENENISQNSGKYTLYNTEQRADDKGIWFNISRTLFPNHNMTGGIDIKQGNMDASDIYRTSTDILTRKGKMNFYALFLQDEANLIKNKLKTIIGLRSDYATFSDGSLLIENPTTNTGFTKNSYQEFPKTHWSSVNPKIAFKYFIKEKVQTYISYSTGFMPPKLDDLCSSRKINKGFKIANPNLLPEKLENYEWGMNIVIANKIKLEPSVYYSIGKDFQYFVGTGDSIDTGGSNLKPILQRRNISKVEIRGAEITATVTINKNITLTSNYSYNQSKIKEYNASTLIDYDLTGKYLIEVPSHLAYTEVLWKNKYVNSCLIYNYTGKQWFDDANTQEIENSSVFDIKFTKQFKKKFHIALSVQNIFNQTYIDRKEYLSIGRFIMGAISMTI